MGTGQNGSSGAADGSGGTNQNNSDPKEGASDDVVKYETYSRVLGEKKKVQSELADAKAKLAEFEADKKAREDAQLKAQGDYEKLEKKLREEAEASKQEAARLKKERLDMVKTSAFLGELSGTIEEPYYDLIPIDQIPVTDDGQVDREKLKPFVKTWEQQHARIIVRQTKGNMPNNAPNGSGGTPLTFEEWSRLPRLEQKKRLHEVLQNDQKKI